jgi:hypothetical protein
MMFSPQIRISCIVAAPPDASPEGSKKDFKLTGEQVLRLAEVRNELLLRLSKLHSPTVALQKLAEFKEDLALKGIELALAKWAIRPGPVQAQT